MPDQDILDSWKEIAAYLKKSERTCRRWEKEFGLPVHRMDASPKAHIFAYKHELDKWIHEKLDSAEAQKKGAISRIRLKKPAIAVAVILTVCSAGVLLWQIFLRKGPSPSSLRPNSVAVLSFIDLSPHKDHEWLSDGLSDDLITALSSLKGLRVLARTSSFFFKGKKLDIQEIGRKLNVENVLDGSVQVVGDRLRVNAHLISVKDGYHLWSNQFDRRLDDVFSIQDEIVREIVKALKVRLLGEEEIQLTKRYTENLEAYNLYLLGRYFWNKRGREDLHKSIEYFEMALEKDPNYVLAYAALANTFLILGNNMFIPPGEAYPKAKEFVLKALEMDSRLAEAHAVLANIKRDYDWDWAGAEKEFKIALQLDPGRGYTHQGYAFLLSNLGRHEEALNEIKTASDLDPLAPRITANVGNILYRARKYDQALEELRKAIDLFPEHTQNYEYEVRVYAARGSYEEAVASLQRFKEITGRDYVHMAAYVYAKWGKREEAEKSLNKLIERSEKTYVSSSGLAKNFGILGDFDRAFSLLEKAYSERDVGLQLLKVDPRFDPLRSDPRFRALLKRMNLH